MKLYNVLKTIRVKGCIIPYSSEDVENYWCVEPPKDAQVVPIGGDNCYETLYAIEYDVNDDFSTEKLMNIMLKKLSIAECKKICKSDKEIEKFYLSYLQNPLNNDEFKDILNKAINS